MKKLFCAGIVTLLATQVYALPFDGAYISGNIGGSKAFIRDKQTAEAPVVIGGTPALDIQQIRNRTINDSTVIGGVELGIGKVFAQYYYLGIEGSALFEDMSSTNNSYLQPSNTTPIAYNLTTQIRLNNEFALTLIPGIVVNKTTLFYGKIGPSWGRFATQGSFMYEQALDPAMIVGNTFKYNENGAYNVGLQLGLGIDHYFTDHFSLKLEYLNTNYGQINSGKVETTSLLLNGAASSLLDGSSLRGRNVISVRNNTVMLGLGYHI